MKKRLYFVYTNTLRERDGLSGSYIYIKYKKITYTIEAPASIVAANVKIYMKYIFQALKYSNMDLRDFLAQKTHADNNGKVWTFVTIEYKYNSNIDLVF